MTPNLMAAEYNGRGIYPPTQHNNGIYYVVEIDEDDYGQIRVKATNGSKVEADRVYSEREREREHITPQATKKKKHERKRPAIIK